MTIKNNVYQLYSEIRKRTIEPGNPNICVEAKLYLFLFMPTLEIVCCETEVLETVISG